MLISFAGKIALMPEHQNRNKSWVLILVEFDNLETLVVEEVQTCRVLIGFHKNDHKFEKKLREKYLIPFQALYKLDIRSEATLLGGAVVEEEIKVLMSKSRILLILLSTSFYLDPSFKRYWENRNKKARTVPIKIEDCFIHPDIGGLQPIPKAPIGSPIKAKEAKAWIEVVIELDKIFQNHCKHCQPKT